MAIFDFFKKRRTDEEAFTHAIGTKDYVTAIKFGKRLLQRDVDSISIINSYSDALIKIGKKDEAVKTLLKFAEKKIREEYYDIAIIVLKKVLKIDPYNIKALRLLTSTYQRKKLFYEAFKLLDETYWQSKKAGLPASNVEDMLENFIKEQSHPLFYEKFADILKSEDKMEGAFKNYVLAGNLYANLHNYKLALIAFLKARKLKKFENLDRHIVDVVVNCDKESAVVLKLVVDNASNLDFLKYVVDTFKSVNKLDILQRIVKRVPIPKVKYFLQALIEFAQGEVENGLELMEKLKLLDRGAYDKLLSIVAVKYPEYTKLTIENMKSTGELPEPEEVLDVLDQAIDLSDVSSPSVEKEDRKNIEKEIRQIESDGIKYISTAEAMLGLGEFDKAIEDAKKALKYDKSFFKAAVLIATAFKLEGKFNEAINFIMDILDDRRLTEKDKAELKEALGENYEAMGKKERALIWYKEAYKVLKEEEIKDKIAELEKSS